MKLNIGEIFNYNEKSMEFEENAVNILIGKNNIGKTKILEGINSNNKNYLIYFLDLNFQPFDDLVKPPSNLTSEKIKSNSYQKIKEIFIDYDLDKKAEEVKDYILKDLNFETKKNKFLNNCDINKYKITIDLDESQIKTLLKKPIVFKGLSLNNETHSIEGIGLGHLRLVMLEILEKMIISKTEQNIILLIDEPEVFLHPNLIKLFSNKIINLIEKNKNITVILSTHSPFVLTEFKYYLNNFKLLKLYEKEIIIKTIKKEKCISYFKNVSENYFFDSKQKSENDKIWNRLISTINFDFSRIFFTDIVIVVEGYSDQIFFEFTKISNTISNEFGDHAIVPIHGLDNLPAAYTLLHEFDINFKFLCDSDFKENKKGIWTQRLQNLQNKNFENISIFENGTLENELDIDSVKKNQKVTNIICNEEKINNIEIAQKLLKYIK